jgi:hypothetical protein
MSHEVGRCPTRVGGYLAGYELYHGGAQSGRSSRATAAMGGELAGGATGGCAEASGAGGFVLPCLARRFLRTSLAATRKRETKVTAEQCDRGPAGELLHFADEQRQTREDEEQVRAEDLERGFAEGEEGLARDRDADIFAQPVEDDEEGRDVEDAEGTDLPLIEQQAEGRLGEVWAQPADNGRRRRTGRRRR